MSSNKTNPPRLLLTMGEPAGVGPELLVRAAQQESNGQLIALADPDLLRNTALAMGLPLTLKPIDWQAEPQATLHGELYFEAISLPEMVKPGHLNVANAAVTLAMLDKASQLALNKKVDALVTGPVHKANLNQIEPTFLGHTEFFAQAANIERVVMMLATSQLRVCLATTHIPLASVSKALTPDLLEKTIQIIVKAFQSYGIEDPQIAVAGLNPHAGEDGLLGQEELETISPLLERLKAQGLSVDGPFPADTLFTLQNRKKYHVFLAMYHDQGLPVIKAIGFGQCANITLGLPYIRTSVDHGTALDIAASYTASSDSMDYAINYALQLASGQIPNESL